MIKMLMKHLLSFSRRRTYSVGKVLVQCMETSDIYRNNLQRYFHIHTNFSRKTLAQDVTAKNAINESCEESIEETNKNPKRRKRKVANDILDYLNEFCPEEIVNKIPKKCLKRSRANEPMYLVNPVVADGIVQCVHSSIVKEGTVVLEANPGLGVLSRKLLDAGVQQLHLHEPSSVFLKTLRELYFHQDDKVFLHSTDLLSIWKIAYQDRMDQGTRLQDILSFIPKKNWDEDPPLKIIGYIQSSDFIKHLIFSIAFQNGFMKHCRPELLVFLQPTFHMRLTCSGEQGYLRYRSLSVLFQIFFDFEILDKIPRKAFLPWPVPLSARKRKADEITALNEEWLYVMKIVPKRDLFEIIPPEKLPPLWYFVRHHFWTRSSKVIQEMESWIPGCGVRLILEGFNIFTEFGDLKPSEVLHLFQLFSSWPEYQDSSFLTSMETAISKIEENNSETIDKSENQPKRGC